MLQRGLYYFLAVWIALVGIKVGVYAQSVPCTLSISGYLHNHLHEPLAGATVFLNELKRGTTTDGNGRYILDELCPGEYTLICQYIGYQQLTKKIFINQSQNLSDIELADEALHLAEIAIEGEKMYLESSATAQSLSGAGLEKTRGKTLGETLQNIAGVNVLQTGPTVAKPVIHGLHSNRVLILNNGIRQEGQQWGSEHAPEIDPFVATQLTVVKGAAAIRYGSEAIGGVVLVEPPTLPTEAKLGAEINTIGMSNGRGGVVSGVLEGGIKPIKGLGWRVQGTYKRLGDFESPHYILSNTAVRELNFSGAVGLHRKKWGAEIFFSRFNTTLGILRSAHTGSLTDLENALNSPTPLFVQDFTYQIDNPKQAIAHNLLKISGFWQVSDNQQVKYQYGFQTNRRMEYDRRRGGRSEIPAMDLTLQTHTLDITYNRPQRGNWRGEWGINSLWQSNTYNAETGVRPLVPQYQNLGLGAFWLEKWTKNKLEFELGLRYDYRFLESKGFDRRQVLQVNRFDFHNVTASLGLVYNFDPHANFRSNLASAWRPPNAAELFSDGLHHGAGGIERGLITQGFNPANIRSEQGYKWVNTLSINRLAHNPHRGWALELTAYYQYIQNYIFLEPRQIEATIRGVFGSFNYNFTNAQFWGIDLWAQKYFAKGFYGEVKGAFLSAKDLTRDSYFIFIPTNRLEYGLGYEAKKGKNWEDFYVQIKVIHSFRQFRAPQVFTIRQINEANEKAESLPNQAFDFVAAPAGYTLVNWESGVSFPLAKQKLGISLIVSNLLNTAYRDYMNRFRYFADELGRNLSLKLKYSFGRG
ncbi:MAG: TonB-dependent receptor [Microscillaceae bacterium]|jgi:iron complex outermembrane receptor protein|nr:TonB-dependent receptor [Microscillaceae bacterium]